MKFDLWDFYMCVGWKKGKRHSILALIHTSILEGQKACYSGQTLGVQWFCHLINLFFSSKMCKRVSILCWHIYIHTTVHSSSDIELHKVMRLKHTAAHALFKDQKASEIMSASCHWLKTSSTNPPPTHMFHEHHLSSRFLLT